MKRLITVAASCALFGSVIACNKSNESDVKTNVSQQQMSSEEAKYSCKPVYRTYDYKVEVTLSGTSKSARFFDSANWHDLDDEYEFKVLESNPPQRQHTFAGADDDAPDQYVYEFIFNETTLKGTYLEHDYLAGGSLDTEMECERIVPDQPKACSDTLGDDANQWLLSADDINDSISEGSVAFEVAKLVAKNSGCDPETLKLESTVGNAPAAACSQVIPQDHNSHVCYVSTNFGYFVVNETFPNGLAVTWSRWD